MYRICQIVYFFSSSLLVFLSLGGPELLRLVSKLQMCFLGTVLRRSHAALTTPLAREEKKAANTIQEAA